MTHQLGDEPIQDKYARKMQAVAEALDAVFNENDERTTGFVLLVFQYDKAGRCNYISNGADRGDIVKLMREQIERFEAGMQ